MWILMLLLSVPLVAQDVTTETPTTIEDSQTLKITVRAKGTGKAIKRAEVRIGERTFFTDPQAQVAISIPRIGDGKIMISKVGFERAFLDFSEIRDTAELEVFLFPATLIAHTLFFEAQVKLFDVLFFAQMGAGVFHHNPAVF